MKVLWFVNTPFPAVTAHLGITNNVRGGWMPSLADNLQSIDGFELAIAWASARVLKPSHIEENSVTYYLFRSKYAYRKASPSSYDNEIKSSLEIISHFKPDLIHIHGTENFYGLISSEVKIPTVVTIQGIVNEISRYFMGGLNIFEQIRNYLLIKEYISFNKRCPIELEIFKRNNNYIGQTNWDKACIKSIRSDCCYYRADRVLRNGFYNVAWEYEKCNVGQIYTTSSDHSYKGLDVLLKAINIVKNKYSDIKLRIAGDVNLSRPFGKLLDKIIKELNLENNISVLGIISENDVVEELTKANVYVMPSFIENESTSLCEAQLVGTPSISSYTGGLPDMVTDGETGMLFSRGDYYVLAEKIMEMLVNKDLAISISKKGRVISHDRHDVKRNLPRIVEIYNDILSVEN